MIFFIDVRVELIHQNLIQVLFNYAVNRVGDGYIKRVESGLTASAR